jgi:hypothetical protein
MHEHDMNMMPAARVPTAALPSACISDSRHTTTTVWTDGDGRHAAARALTALTRSRAGPLLARPPLEVRGRRCTSPNQQRPPPSSFAHTACSCRFRHGRAQDTMTHGPTWHTPLVTRTCGYVYVQHSWSRNDPRKHATCILWLPTVNCCARDYAIQTKRRFVWLRTLLEKCTSRARARERTHLDLRRTWWRMQGLRPIDE